jgi:type I restriction enzyme S subunit
MSGTSHPANAYQWSNIDATVISTSFVAQGNPKLRIDAGYFGIDALAASGAIERIPHSRLGDLVSVFRKGIFDIKADTYSETGDGVPFVRIGDLKGGLINKDTTEWITHSAHEAEQKTTLVYGDIILSKTAYPAACFVNLEECNLSQDTIAVKLTVAAKKDFKEGYIVAFLNSSFGMPLMQREFQGNVQEHLSLDDGKKLKIPKIKMALQAQIDGLYRQADRVRDSARASLAKAEEILSTSLGLDKVKPADAPGFIVSFSSLSGSKRLDSQFHAPRIRQIIDVLSKSGLTVADVAIPRRQRFDKALCQSFDYIEIGDVGDAGTVGSSRLACADAPSRATWHVQDDDVITSMVRPIRRLSAQISKEQAGFVCSSGFVVLTPKNIKPEVLLTFLRLPVVCELMDLYASASMYPAISEADLLNLPFPKVTSPTSTQICSLVKQARDARTSAADMLIKAVNAVEVAIQSGESAALAFLAKRPQQ